MEGRKRMEREREGKEKRRGRGGLGGMESEPFFLRV
jgi:hypothetical protein